MPVVKRHEMPDSSEIERRAMEEIDERLSREARGRRIAEVLSSSDPVDPSYWDDPEKAIQPPIQSQIEPEEFGHPCLDCMLYEKCTNFGLSVSDWRHILIKARECLGSAAEEADMRELVIAGAYPGLDEDFFDASLTCAREQMRVGNDQA